MFRRYIAFVLALGTTGLVIEADAVEGEIDPHYGNFVLSAESPSPDLDLLIFRERFDVAYVRNVNGIFADELHPLNVIKWNIDLKGTDFSDNLHDRITSKARSAFAKSIEYGIRDAAVEAPLLLWLDQHHSWFAELIRGSVGNVEEESLAPLDVAYRGGEQSWWKNMLRTGGTHYGLRPFSTSPYAYVSHAIKDSGKTVLLANVRYYYDRFSDHRFELSLSLPLAYGLAIDLGSAYEFRNHDDARFVIKLLKEFKGGGIAHLGFEVRDYPELIAGISFRW
jgi:hypothetical protein